MKSWIDISRIQYRIPLDLDPNTEYIVRIETEQPQHAKLTLDGISLGNFFDGMLSFTSGLGDNKLTISTDLYSQTINKITVNEIVIDFKDTDTGFIKLFDATDKVFTSNGITTMKPLKLKETKKISLNGWFIDVEVDLKYKDFLEQDMLAVIKTKSKINPQAFRIDNLNYNKRTITFTAHHVMFDAHDYYLVDVRPTSMGAVGALNYVNERTDRTSPFSFTSDVNNSQTAYFLDRSLFYAMQVIAEQWGGYYDADNWNVNLKNVIGVDRGDTISYGKNLEDIKVYENWSDVVTKVYPVGFDGLRLPEVYLQSEVQYEVPYTKRVDFETKFEGEDQTVENMLPELRANATEFINNNYLPKVSYEVVSNINQRLDIGDTVSVKHPLVSLVTEVQEYEYDVLKGRVVKLAFGNYVRDVKNKVGSIKDDIKKNSDQIQVAESKFQQIIGEQTDIINNMNKLGHVYQDDNQILILDKLPKEDAVNVWRWNLGGLAFSENGIEGPYKQAWTMDGTFNTEFIAANSILTNQLSSDVGSSLDISSNVAITQIVDQIGNGNILPNGSGELGYYGYIGGSDLVYTDDLVYQDYMTYSHGFIPKKMLGSLSEWGLSFINSGYDITPSAYVVPNTQYAYKAKVERFKPFSIQLLEFKNIEDSENLVIHKSTTHTFNNPMQYVSFTQELDVETQFTRIRYNRTGVTYLDRLEITEVMLNRGAPKEWQPSASNAMIYSQTTRTQLSDRIDDVVDTVEVIDGQVFVNKTNITQLGNEIELKVNVNGVISAINLTSEQAKILANHISLEGLTTINGNFKVLPNGDVEFINAKGTNVNLTGEINATSGDIGNFAIQNGVMTYTTGLVQREYTSADVVTVREMLYGTITPNAYQLFIYDVNNSGTIDIDDLMRIYNYTIGIGAKPIKMIRNRVLLGTSTGEVTASVLYGANNAVGATSRIVGETITTPLLNVEDISIAGKRIEVDSNGFMKLVSMV